jgi:MFS family permease
MLRLLPLRALAYRNFRLYFFGQGVSVLGTWMQQVAVAWTVYCLTQSPLWLGLVGFSGQIPSLFISPLAGALIDRVNRHRLVLLTQALAMVLALTLAVLAFTECVSVWQLVILSLLSGVIDAFDIPARQFLLTEMVGNGDDLANAIALNSSIFNGARLVGPALAGFLLAWTSAGVCFLANGISYLAVLAALLAMRLPASNRSGTPGRLLGGVWEGFAYAWGYSAIRAVLLLTGSVGMAAMASSTLLPMVATAGPDGGASVLGLLTAATGAGALAGTILLAARKSVVGLGKWIAASPALYGFGLIGFTLCGSLWASALLLAMAGFALLLLMAASNTVLQTIVDESKRGRVMSLFTMAVTGLAPLGGLLAGLLANQVGAPVTLRIAGLACVVVSLVFMAYYPRLRAQTLPTLPEHIRREIAMKSGWQVAKRFPPRVTVYQARLTLSATEANGIRASGQ